MAERASNGRWRQEKSYANRRDDKQDLCMSKANYRKNFASKLVPDK